MNKFILGALLTMTVIGNVGAVEKTLPEPEKNGGMPLMQVIAQRRSIRAFADKKIDNQTLSNILWSAYGVSDDEGRRTIPTAMNKKELEVYVATDDGVWLYDADGNKLVQISEQNILDDFKTQDYMENAPLNLIFTADKEAKYADMHAGSAYQNVGLYATSAGLNMVVRGYFDHDKVAKDIKLPANKKVIVSQAIGWKK